MKVGHLAACLPGQRLGWEARLLSARADVVVVATTAGREQELHQQTDLGHAPV